MAESKVQYRTAALAEVKARVGLVLESHYKLDINTREKVLGGYFDEDQLPHWYYFSNTPEEIARHLFVMTRLLDANTGQVHSVSDDSRVITYLINVGRDFPGRLEGIVERNASMRIASYDSETTRNGVRIVSIERATEEPRSAGGRASPAAEALKDELRRYGDERGFSRAGDFVDGLSSRYLQEEILSARSPRRAERHMDAVLKAASEPLPVVEMEEVRHEDDTGRTELSVRVMVAAASPGPRFITDLLSVFERRGINLRRSYYDSFSLGEDRFGVLSAYFAPGCAIGGLAEEIRRSAAVGTESPGCGSGLPRRIEGIIRRLSGGGPEAGSALAELRALCAANAQGDGGESGNFYLNSVTDFLAAADSTGLGRSEAALRLLLGYEAFDEFFVVSREKGREANVPGYRIKHSTARGPAKGGLRIDPIVAFDEVAALSFMMTWKCARSRILFGGGKGGLVLDPRGFEGTPIDFFDTLSSFGRNLFLVSGPLLDVPAGDVGCGPAEIGHMFEGFKSALRDLAMMAYGLKPGVTMIGSRIVSLEDARRMLRDRFGVDCGDPTVLGELVRNEEYLELVAAAQITGKPKLGIAARGAATGLGMAYAVLAAVGNLYAEGRWESSRRLSAEGEALLRKALSLDEGSILREESPAAYAADPGAAGRLSGRLLSAEEWRVLRDSVYPALLEGKSLVVQGSGKVGGALIASLAPYGVRLAAVADAGGAVAGDRLDPEEVLRAVSESRGHPDKSKRASVVHATKGVLERIEGAAAGAKVLELECDILAPSALENSITEANAARIRAKIEVCGANGPNSSRAEKILADRGVAVLYDFLANGAGVTASYFEWLRNMSDRLRFEAESIRGEAYDVDSMDPYVMPEFGPRIKAILSVPESAETTEAWNLLLRDIMFAAVNEDWAYARAQGVSLKTAGFANSQFRVLAAALAGADAAERDRVLADLPEGARRTLERFEAHPDAVLAASRAAK